MKAAIVCLLGMLLLSGTMAQTEPCDPATAGTALVDLSTDIGTLACKVPSSVNLTATMSKLTGVLNVINAQQLKQLPDLMRLTVGVKPSALLPLLSLNGDQLTRLTPLLTNVKTDTLKIVFPLLARQPQSTVDKMIRFLRQVPRSQLEKLAPLFGSLTEGQVNVLVHALQNMPQAAWYKLINLLRALGPVTDSVIAAKQSVGLFPVQRTTSTATTSTTATTTTVSGTTGSAARAGTITIGPGRFFGGFRTGKGIVFGRKLQQQSDEDKAAAALAAAAAQSQQESSAGAAAAPAASGACDPAVVGLEIGVALVADFGAVVCKFGADALTGPLTEILKILNGANQETLAALPELTDALAKLDAKAFDAFFKIPTATLQELIPVLETLDPNVVSEQLKTFGNLDQATIDSMVYFLQITPPDRISTLLPLFSRLNEKQIDTLAMLLNSLSVGQIQLGLHLLTVFGPAIDVIGQKIPQQQNRGNTFMIGPIRVTMGSTAASQQVVRPGIKFPFILG